MTMREKMARAINEVANKRFNASMIDKDWSFALADAALDALMEPTEAMLSEGGSHGEGWRYHPWTHHLGGLTSTQIAPCFQAMIRAARDGK